MNLIGKYAFISHPYAKNPKENKVKVEKVCKYWINQGVIPISPLHLFMFYEDDSRREEIMNICYRLIDIADVVFIYGDSKGCKLERKYAEEIGKPVYIFYKEKDINYTNCMYLMRERGGVNI